MQNFTMPKRKRIPKKIRVSFYLPTYVNITRNDIIIMLFIFLFVAFTSPPRYSDIGFLGTYFVLLVYLFHAVVVVVIGRYIWDNFLNEFIKVRQLHLDGKQRKMR